MAMTEVNLSDNTLPSIARFTLDGSTANKAHQINLRAADSATKVTVRFDDADGKIALQVVDFQSLCAAANDGACLRATGSSNADCP